MPHDGDLYDEMINRQNLTSIIYHQNMRKIHFVIVVIHLYSILLPEFGSDGEGAPRKT